MDISNITDLTTLKAMAYDELAKIEQAQKNLQLLNQQIANASDGTAAAAANPKVAADEHAANASEPTGETDATDDTGTTTTAANE